MTLKSLDVFSGIGGFATGFERSFIETIAFCEIDPFCQKVLTKRWPNVALYDDIKLLAWEQLTDDGFTTIDVICGGFPCQDISIAGQREGIHGVRSNLWEELCRLIGSIRPRYAVVENVTNLLTGERGQWFGTVLRDLAEIGYDAEWHCIPAAALGASHLRDRVWIIAYPSCNQNDEKFAGVWPGVAGETCPTANYQQCRGSTETEILRQPVLSPQSLRTFTRFCRLPYLPASRVCRSTDGIPHRAHRLRTLGNSIMPQIAQYIGWCLTNT